MALLQTLESDAYVCIREKKNEAAQPEVVIVELKNGNNVTRRPIKADSAIMHWNRQVIALKAQSRTLQIFDLEQKKKLKSCTMNEDVQFWRWISDSTLGLVTTSSVYHWDVYDASQEAPSKVFERNANLNVHSTLVFPDLPVPHELTVPFFSQGCQIINYRANEDGKWMVVVGISSQQGRVVGAMQLYSKDRGISQAIEGHAAAFGSLRLESLRRFPTLARAYLPKPGQCDKEEKARSV